MSRKQATFDEHDWCDKPGWAGFQGRYMPRLRLRCWLGRHKMPARPPAKPNGHSPSNYAQCARCDAGVHWFIEGQHLHGGVNRYFATLNNAGAPVSKESTE